MQIKKIGKIMTGQDGAMYDGELFRFDASGNCIVYDVSALSGEPSPKAVFRLDKHELICPHSNAVCFGTKYFAEGDKYPLLYTNVYNNYSRSEDKLIGVTCVYRIERDGDGFKSTLVQLIEIGFVEDTELWRATPDSHGVRPYGNFLIDLDDGSFWAYTMINEERGTAYFRFDTPDVFDGFLDERLGVRRAVLSREDIRESFTLGFSYFLQGGIIHNGRLYSTEGFTAEGDDKPAIRVIDLKERREEYIPLAPLGMEEEPEFIDFSHGVCYFGDWLGTVYTVSF